jgi:hypothetical protein
MRKTSGAAVPPLLLSMGTFTFTGTVVEADEDVPMSIFSIIFSPSAFFL